MAVFWNWKVMKILLTLIKSEYFPPSCKISNIQYLDTTIKEVIITNYNVLYRVDDVSLRQVPILTVKWLTIHSKCWESKY